MPVCLDMLRPALGLMIYFGVGSMGLIRGLDSEIGFGPRKTLESMCAWLRDQSIIINEPRYSTVSGCVRAVIVCRRRRRLGLIRGFGCEIGFGPASGPWPAWRLAGHGLGTAGFRRCRIDADCASLPDHLFP